MANQARFRFSFARSAGPGALAAALLFAPWAAADPHLPPMQATNLMDNAVSLPEGLSGQRNILLIAFDHDQQEEIDTWIGPVSELVAEDPTLNYYELAAIGPMNGLVKVFIERGMRSGVETPAQRTRTLIVYDGKEALKEGLEISDESRIYTVYIDKTGFQFWRAEGVWTQEKFNELLEMLGRAPQ